MSAPSFTPGPWYVTEAAEDLGYCRIREEASDYVLATADDGGHVDPKFALPPETIEANARLIAAAPELYEAAQTVLDGLNERIDNAPLNCVPVFAGIADLASALAKARGEQ